jgi:uncharacterized protein YdhG (YjbR/CyaY superfamily)
LNTAADIDQYLAGVPDVARPALEHLRATIKAVAPDAVEVFAYGMPGFKYRGKPLAYIAAMKSHCALYGLDTKPAEQAGYDTSQKGTIRFPHDKPPPDSLVTELLNLRIAAIEAAAADRRPKSRAGGRK